MPACCHALQDALAELVAAEMKKIIKKELQPSAPPASVPQEDEVLNDIEALQVNSIKIVSLTTVYIGKS